MGLAVVTRAGRFALRMQGRRWTKRRAKLRPIFRSLRDQLAGKRFIVPSARQLDAMFKQAYAPIPAMLTVFEEMSDEVFGERGTHAIPIDLTRRAED